MSKSSVDYTELAGLRVALGNLQLVPIDQQDEDWVSITNWMKARIKELEKK